MGLLGVAKEFPKGFPGLFIGNKRLCRCFVWIPCGFLGASRRLIESSSRLFRDSSRLFRDSSRLLRGYARPLCGHHTSFSSGSQGLFVGFLSRSQELANGFTVP